MNISTGFIITKSIGIVLSRMQYFVRPFQQHAQHDMDSYKSNCPGLLTSIGESWSFSFVSACMHKLACIIPTGYAKSNLGLLTCHLLPSNDLFRTPQCLVRLLYLTHPLHAGFRNKSNSSFGNLKQNYGSVVVFVIWTTALAHKLDGQFKNVSNQSILIATFSIPNNGKPLGIVFWKFSHSDQGIILLTLISNWVCHFSRILDPIPGEKAYRYAKQIDHIQS